VRYSIAALLLLTHLLSAVEAPSQPTIENEWIRVRIDPTYAAIAAVELPGVKPLDIPDYLDYRPTPDGDVPVLGGFNQPGMDGSGQRHNLLYDPRLPEQSREDVLCQEPWQVAESGAQRVVLTTSNPDDTLRFEMVYELLPDKPIIQTSLRVHNTGPERSLPLVMVSLNGVYHDFGARESYYSGQFRSQPDGTLERLDVPPAGTWGEPFELQPDDFLCSRSRFFGAYWQLRSVERNLPADVASTEPVAGMARGPETIEAAAAPTDGARVLITPRGFLDRADKITPQVWYKVAFQDAAGGHLHLASDGDLELQWEITATILTHDALSRLSEAKQELEYPDGMVRFFRILSVIMGWMLRIIHTGFALIGLSEIGYGLSVIVVTLLIKAAMHRLTVKQQRSMMMMQKLAPELQKLKAQYGDNQQVMAQKQMELWRKNGVNPLSGCLPMLVQMPIFIALYWTFSLAADLRGHGFLWVRDLTLADNTFFLGFTLPWLGPATINLLPLAYIGFSFWMSFSQKPPTGGDGNDMQQQMAKTMRWMPLIFGLIFYNMPAGLVLYFTVNIVLSTLEMRYVRKKLGMDGAGGPVAF
jgi:YidC/Oxa1 family membrane protein insertase